MVDLQRQIVEVSLALDDLSSICMLTSHNFVLSVKEENLTKNLK